MTLFEFLYHEECHFILSRKTLRISTFLSGYHTYFEGRIIDYIPYYLLKKQVYRVILHDNDVIEVFVKKGKESL